MSIKKLFDSVRTTNQYSDFVVTKTADVLDLTNDGPY